MSSRKPPSSPDDWDDFDIPTWDDSARSTPARSQPSTTNRGSGRRDSYRDPLYDDYQPPARPTGRTPTGSGQPPRLSSRVPTRSTRPTREDPYRDPYSLDSDDYAGAALYPEPPAREPVRHGAATSQYDLYADPSADLEWGEPAPYQDVPAPRRRSRSGARSARPAVTVARPTFSDSAIASTVGLGILSLLVMAGAVWYGLGNVAQILPWHIDSAGNVDRWVTQDALWRIPFGSFMALAIGAILGAFLWNRDRFAARFIIVSMCAVQVLAWVAVIDQLW